MSTSVPRVTADMVPRVTPSTTAIKYEIPESWRVAGSFSMMMRSEFRLCQSESPKSP